jgi:hypothetical protein
MPFINLEQYGTVTGYIQSVSHPDFPSRLLDPLPRPILQHGETCKLYALSTVMQWLHGKYPDAIQLPPPARKQDNTFWSERLYGRNSLRRQAKENFGSRVGEIYDHRTLAELAKRNGFDNVRIINSANADYLLHLLDEIDKGNAPIVFYDVSTDGEGVPILGNSEREHAAVVAGYYVNQKGSLDLILLQWGQYYSVCAGDLLRSANQLNENRQPEQFYKSKSGWHVAEPLLVAAYSLLCKTATGKAPVSTADANFRNKIIVLDPPSPALTAAPRV